MRAIQSGLDLAQELGAEVIVYWEQNKGCNCRFEDLFEPIPNVRVRSYPATELKKLSLRALVWRAFWKLAPWDFVINDAVAGRRDQIGTASQGKARIFVRTEKRFYGNAPYFRQFVPREALRLETDRFWAELPQARTVGVHIRRTDNAQAIQQSPNEAFVSAMERELVDDPSTCFLVATDDKTVLDQLNVVFPGRIFTRPHRPGRDSKGAIQDAVIDLQLLSRCEKVLGSHWSSFSHTAAEWGQIPELTVRGPEPGGNTP